MTSCTECALGYSLLDVLSACVLHNRDKTSTSDLWDRMDSNAVHNPSQATCSTEEAAQSAKETDDTCWNLLPDESLWRDRYTFLKTHGYQLRPRFSPNWTPSWLGTNLDPFFCEDSICSWVRYLILSFLISLLSLLPR